MKSSDNITVLLIEDDPMVQEVNRQMIEKVEGFQVAAAAGNGKEGVELAEKQRPDLVILDIFMPELDGMKTFSTFRREELDIDVIVISAADDKETIRKAIQNGAIDYIIKPFKFDRLAQALNRYKVFLRQFSGINKTEQQAIDSWVSPNAENQTDVFLPKGLNQQTLTQVKNYLADQNLPVSADEAASHIGIARVTARRYLDYMVKAEQAEIHLRYGEVGRPINRYQLK
ncbi:two-component system, CitB family, response regulator DctR [Lentibacillus halodurans]|uniref:Two-component system, CitB family, response regulator DctR n=1 Tax=Lentibacillus halodurans TaxID=237679 RepID=A0A1I0YFT6_9BACI|nr:response regulator [Lentibacillus halodurans]SFB12061.1 two-component system, CitB family, response regulator DctR [Lentibacillus halodurans]